MFYFITASLTALIVTICTTPLVIRFATHFQLVDDPKKRKHPAQTHVGIIPRAGGLAIYCGIVISASLFLPMTKPVIGILLASTLAVLIGLFDDWKDSSPYLRFGGNIITALIVVGVGIGTPYITNPLGGIIHLDTWRISFNLWGPHSILVWADFFAITWIVWTMNIVGWSSGVDGQMPGFVAITAFILGILSLRFSAHDISQVTVATLAFIVAGAYVGFIPWNFYPQKIMPGYGGKTLAGLLLATLAILSGGKIGSALLVLAVPTIDAVYTLMRRVSKFRSPFRADRNHFHHHLLSLGWGKRRIALFYWSISAILGISTLTFSSQQKVFIFLTIVVICMVVVFGISNVLLRNNKKD